MEQNSDMAEKARKEIKAKDYDRFLRGIEVTQGKKAESYWIREYKKMNDSLRMDSIAKAAYAKGLNAVKQNVK